MSVDVIVCALVADQPHPVPGATVAWCDLCAEPVWLSPTSKRHFDAGDASTIRCFDCALGTAPPDAEMTVFPEDKGKPIAAHAAQLNRLHHSGALRPDRKNQT